jgi:hypothetical protein
LSLSNVNKTPEMMQKVVMQLVEKIEEKVATTNLVSK